MFECLNDDGIVSQTGIYNAEIDIRDRISCFLLSNFAIAETNRYNVAKSETAE